MGGSNSGRWGGRPTIDSGFHLDIGMLMRGGLIIPARLTTGLLHWTNKSTGEKIANVGFEANVETERGTLRLFYQSTVWATDEKRQSDYAIPIVSSQQPFGGRRWWFLCPRTGARVLKLYMPNGAFSFAARHTYRLGYRSQRETLHDRALRRAFKLRERLGNDGGIGDVILKPKGMHQTTFEKRMLPIGKAEAVCNAYLYDFLQRFQAKAYPDRV